MSVLINLLPDTRQVKQRDKRRRQLATGLALAVWMVCGGALVLLTLYTTGQKLIISNLTRDIQTKQKQLEEVQGLPEALTAQQHLAALPGLYSQRAYLTKFLHAYGEANPQEVALTSLTVDASNALAVNGTANSYFAVAKLARALEAENVTVGSSASAGNQPYFTEVAIQSASRSNNQVNFTLNAVLAPGVTSGN